MAEFDDSSKTGWPRPFGKYELIRKIGSGGMAEVFLARSFGAEGLEKQLVIKRILPEYARKDRFVSMFIDEAKLAVSLNHPNIVQTYDFGRVGDDYYLAMEFVDGTDLARVSSRLRRADRRLPLGDAIFLAVELCKGLDYAHRRTDKYGEPLHLVHRDISPQNLLISHEGNLKIVDFGIAHARNMSIEPAGLIKGKYSYMSPEQASGRPVDLRSDLFSAGVVLFELVYGRPLFRFTTSEETLDAVRRAAVPALHELADDVPDSVERILYRALDRDAQKRYATARDFQIDLHRVMFELGEIHDAHSVSTFLTELAAETSLTRPGGSSQAATVVHAQQARTPPLPGGAASSTSMLVGPPELTPATPALRGHGLSQVGQHSLVHDLRHTKKDVICVAGSIRGFEALRASEASDRSQGLVIELMRIVEAIAFKNRAIVDHFSDSRFLLLLGLPVSGENDAERALWLAQDLLEAVAGINHNLDTPLELSLGVALGRALLERAHDGSHSRRLLGQVTALAHRMASEARAREIVVGGRIYQRSRRAFELAYFGQLAPSDTDVMSDDTEIAGESGWNRPSLYRLVRPKNRRERQAELRESFGQLYGRDLALKAIRERFHLVQVDGRTLGFAFEGQPGFGKSAVVDEFLRGIEGQRRLDTTGAAGTTLDGIEADEHARWSPAFTILRSSATTHETDTPYALVRELVADLLGVDPDDDPRRIIERIDDRLDEAWEGQLDGVERDYLVHSLRFFFDLRDADSPIEALHGSRRRARLFLSLERLIERVARDQALVIVAEDVHHADASSLEFLASLLQGRLKAPILVVMTLRPLSESSLALERLVYGDDVQVEVLGELSRRDATALVRERLGEMELDRVALDYILDRAGGVPVFICELVDALRARKILRVVNGRFTLGGSAHETWLPTSLEAVVAARIDQLEPELKQALRGGSVLGPEFERRDAIFLMGNEVIVPLERLVQLGWLKRSRSRRDDAAGRVYRFAHTLTYEVAFRELLWEEREAQHARLAAHLVEESEAGRRQADMATIARHLEGARRHVEAARYYQRAALEALRDSSHVEALRMVNRAQELVEDDDHKRTFELLQLKDTLLSALSHHEERLETLEAMRAHADAHLGDAEQLDVINRLGRYWIDQRQLERAEVCVDEVLARTDESHHLRELSMARKIAATLHRESGDAAEAIALLGQAMIGFVGEDDRGSAARTAKSIGDTYWQMGRFEDALEAYEDALSMVTADEDRDLHEVVTVNMALVRVSLGDFEPALEHYIDALRSCRTIGFQRREAAILPNLGHLYMLLGQCSRAERTLHRAVRLARRIRDNFVLCDAILTLGVVYLERGKLDKAEDVLRRGLRLATETEINYLHIHAELALSRLHLMRAEAEPDAASARPHLEQVLELAADAVQRGQTASMIHGVAHGQHLLSLATARLGQADEALDIGGRAIESSDQGRVQGREVILHEQALLLETLAPHEAARAHELLARAANLVEELAGRLTDDARREQFLSRTSHVRILADWQRRAETAPAQLKRRPATADP